MIVRDVMSTGVVTAKRTDTLRSVVIKMISRHCGAVPVVSDTWTLEGLVSLRDALIPLYPKMGDYIHDNVHSRDFVAMEEAFGKVLNKTAGEVMTPNPLTVSPDEPILKAASYMGLKNFRRIPVEENGKLVGMVSIGDINRGLFFKTPIAP